jgi:adenylate kinase family enzyme
MHKRIHITGNAGSGKSTLAAALGERTGLPVFGLDSIVWQEGWKPTPLDERRALEAELAARDSWIVEGVSPVFREAADLVIYLDVPRRVCAWRCVKRNLPYMFRSRPGLPENCPEWRIAPKLTQIIWQFSRVMHEKIIAGGDGSAQFVHLRSSGEIENWVADFSIHYS